MNIIFIPLQEKIQIYLLKKIEKLINNVKPNLIINAVAKVEELLPTIQTEQNLY